MKTMNRLLAIALGLAAQAALAQTYPAAPSSPASPSSRPAQPMPATPAPPSDMTTPAAPGPASGTDASGDSSVSAPASSGGSGPSSSAPPDSGSGADTPASMQDSSGASGMQSEAGAELRAAPEPAARLQPQTQNDVTYLCGGVGADEASYMKQQARGYDLMLTFATRSGAYLADVNVDIRDAKGNPVLQTRCDSPMLLVDLPRSGTYRIHADTAGYALDRTARVKAKEKTSPHLASLVMTWPQQVAEAPAETGTATGSSGTGGSGAQGGPGGKADGNGAGNADEAR